MRKSGKQCNEMDDETIHIKQDNRTPRCEQEEKSEDTWKTNGCIWKQAGKIVCMQLECGIRDPMRTELWVAMFKRVCASVIARAKKEGKGVKVKQNPAGSPNGRP